MRTRLASPRLLLVILAGLLAAGASACKRHGVAGRVLLIGVDGADWRILEPLVAQGRLPTFASLMARGSYGQLETIEPILSPIIWTTIATGRKPDEHGITWFMERDNSTGKARPITSRLRQTKAVWNIASAAGLSVGVVGWWASWPAESINGWVVTDHMAAHGFGLDAKNVATELGRTFPPELDKHLAPLVVAPRDIADDEVRKYMTVTDQELATRRGDRMVFSNPLHHFIFALAGHRTYAAIAEAMQKELQPDLGMVYFEGTDSVSHLFIKYADPPLAGIDEGLRAKFKDIVPRFYERQDRVLAELLRASGEDTNVVIVSDHGFKTGDARLREVDNTDIKQAHLWHEKQGVILVAGPAFKQGQHLQARVYDVTPTLLYLLGLAKADDMPGRVLVEALRDDLLAAHPPRSVRTYETGERRETPPPAEAAADGVAPGGAATAPVRQAEAAPDGKPGAAADIDPDLVARLAALGYMDASAAPEVLLNRADIALRNGDTTAARAAINELLASHPDQAEALVALGGIETQAGNLELAEETYARGARSKVQKTRRAAERGLARTLLALARPVEAERLLRGLLATAPEGEDEYHLGLALEAQDKPEAALEAYDKARALSPALAGSALNNMGRMALRLGQTDVARARFEAALAAEPKHPQALYNLGLIDEGAGQQELAMRRFAEAAAADPHFADARWALAVRYVKRADAASAERWLAELVVLTPRRAEVWKLRASVAETLGHQEEAARYREQASKLARP
jgi:Tfp pilus assembly protein PilF/predicted AlkP superfamily pyrophosphatase or phosphodiesterase